MGEVQGSTKLLQDDAPDATFSSAGSRKGQNKGIVSILTMLKEDLQDEIKNGAKEEAATHAKFEAAVADAKATIARLTERKTNLEESIATAEDSIASSKADKDD